ncbi:polysaccharide biosynthesis C-terminal domain-containing protein [archaeon]
MSRKDLIADTSKYGTSMLVNNILMMIRGIIVANVLGPGMYGVWSTLHVILNWGEMSHIGLRSALMRESAFLIGKGDTKKADFVRDVAFSTMLLFSAAFAIAVIIGSLVFELPELLVTTSWAIALGAILLQLYSALTVLMRSQGDFSGVSKGITLLGVLTFVLTLAFIFPFGLWGAIAALLVSYLVVIIYLKKWHGVGFTLRLDFKEAKRLIKVGLPLFFLSSSLVALRTIDKVIIAGFLNMEQVGYYTVGIVVISFLYFIPSSFVDVVYQRTLKRLGETGSSSGVKKHAVLPNLFLAYLMPFFIAAVYMTAPLAIRFIAPAYIPGIDAMRILVLGAFFYSLYFSPGNFLIAIRKEKVAMVGIAIALATNIVINYFMVTNGYGIEGVAFGTLVSYFILAAITSFSSISTYPEKSAAKYLANLFFPFLWLAAAITVTTLVIGDGIGIILTAQRLALSLILLAPLAYLGEKQTGALSDVKAFVLERFRL